MTRTFAIIKPDAMRAGQAGAIQAILRDNGFTSVRVLFTRLSREQAGDLYRDLVGKQHHKPQIAFMTSGDVLALVLEKEGRNAIGDLRTLVGATMPADRRDGTIRKLYGHPEIVRENAIHASDSPEAVEREIAIVFGG